MREVQDLTGPGFSGVSLTARKGEIIGLTGLQGSGSSEWMQAVFGALPVQQGTVAAFGKTVKPGSIHRAMAAGIAMLPGNRKENSVIPDLNLMDNLALAEQALSAWDFPIRRRAARKTFEHYKALLHIKAQDAADPITSHRVCLRRAAAVWVLLRRRGQGTVRPAAAVLRTVSVRGGAGAFGGGIWGRAVADAAVSG